jgi:tetratricopeptide (TPR) repeat protein
MSTPILRKKVSQNSRDAADRARDGRRWREAARLYSLYLKQHPDDFSIWVQCGHAEKESGEFDRAEQCYLTAKRICDTDSDLHLQLGHLYKLGGRLTEAVEAYQRSIELDPDMVDAAAELRALEREGRISISTKGRFIDALAPGPGGSGTTELSVEVPVHVLSKEETLLLYVKQQSSPWKVAVLLRAFLRIAPTDPSRWYTLADALDRLGEENQAMRCRRVAISLAGRVVGNDEGVS